MYDVEEDVAIRAAPKQRRHGVGLCLSGGGFRAALYHLGALRRLHELGILRQVDTISSVSGGSILAAFLADRIVHLRRSSLAFDDWDREVAEPFRAFVGRDLRTILILAHILWNWALPRFRARHLERTYKNRLTRLLLKDLPEQPKFIFCATDLTFGVNWVFSRKGAGDYQTGYISTARNWAVARAVAASSAFPPIFGPLPIRVTPDAFRGGKYRLDDRNELLSRIELSDGGLYDNMGLEPIWKSHRYVIVSDCGAPFPFERGRNAVRRLLRYTSVMGNQALSVRRRLLFSSFDDDKFKGCYWSLTYAGKHGEPFADQFRGYSKGVARKLISKIRTDLDNFTEAEICILENHGYYAAERERCEAACRSSFNHAHPWRFRILLGRTKQTWWQP